MAEYNCINCKYGNTTDDYEHCGNCDKGSEFVKMTNADRIRSMSDEELAEFLIGFDVCDLCKLEVGECFKTTDCEKRSVKVTVDWLKSEVKE